MDAGQTISNQHLFYGILFPTTVRCRIASNAGAMYNPQYSQCMASLLPVGFFGPHSYGLRPEVYE